MYFIEDLYLKHVEFLIPRKLEKNEYSDIVRIISVHAQKAQEYPKQALYLLLFSNYAIKWIFETVQSISSLRKKTIN